MIIFYTLRNTTINKLTLMLRLDFIKGVENNLTTVWGLEKISLNDILDKQSLSQKRFY